MVRANSEDKPPTSARRWQLGSHHRRANPSFPPEYASTDYKPQRVTRPWRRGSGLSCLPTLESGHPRSFMRAELHQGGGAHGYGARQAALARQGVAAAPSSEPQAAGWPLSRRPSRRNMNKQPLKTLAQSVKRSQDHRRNIRRRGRRRNEVAGTRNLRQFRRWDSSPGDARY